mmetsp:Transcript_84572/g.222938  ORF Transcript_84572/g.222938 Transcript_84572/m.222938 type:complete len:212 (-) Transcript_84572:2-637(-)
MAGLSQSTALLATFVISFGQVAAVMANSQLVDWKGRRFVAISGTVVVFIGLGFLTGSFCLRAGHQLPMLAPVLAISGMVLFRVAFSFSLATLPYIMSTELFPQEVRAVGSSMAWVVNWAANCAVSQSFPVMQELLAKQTGSDDRAAAIIFGAFLTCTLVALIFVLLLLPETTGVRLERPGECGGAQKALEALEGRQFESTDGAKAAKAAAS